MHVCFHVQYVCTYMCNSIQWDGLYAYIHTGITVNTTYSNITILQGDDITLSCTPSESDVALQWSYNGNNISSLPYYQFTPPFLNHDLTITHASDTDSGDYVCAFKSRNEVIAQQSITLVVVLSKCDYNKKYFELMT